MRKTKKLLALALAVVISVSTLGMTASADEYYGDIAYGAATTTASLLMSFESVFAALSGLAAGYIGWIDDATFTLTEGIGCLLVFAAIMLSQIPVKTKAE